MPENRQSDCRPQSKRDAVRKQRKEAREEQAVGRIGIGINIRNMERFLKRFAISIDVVDEHILLGPDQCPTQPDIHKIKAKQRIRLKPYTITPDQNGRASVRERECKKVE